MASTKRDSREVLPIEARSDRLKKYSFQLRISEIGAVISVGDGIAWISGLPSASMDEIIKLDDGSQALVFHLAKERLGAILLRQTEKLTAGTAAYLSGTQLSISVGDNFLGRVIDPLGEPLDGLPLPATDASCVPER